MQAQILDMLARQKAERSMAMILVSHDLAVVATRTDTIVVMYAGRIRRVAPTRDPFSDARHPNTAALMDDHPEDVGSRHARLRTIPGRPPDPVELPEGVRVGA